MKKSKLVKLSAVMIALMSCYDINAETVEKNGALLNLSTQIPLAEVGQVGYSSDSVGFAPDACFNPSSITPGTQYNRLLSVQSEGIEQIAGELSISGDIGAKYNIFSASDVFKYLNSMQENDLSLSANYYEVFGIKKDIHYPTGEMLLNTDGKIRYQNGLDPTFRLFCGDRLVSSYKEGAMLSLSIKIKFHSHADKQLFTNKFGTKFGDFLNASAEISSDMQRSGLQGSIIIDAMQLGGDPSQLSKILSSSMTKCDINNVAACQDVISSLYYYASQIFPAQFKDGAGQLWPSALAPLSYTLGRSIDEYGIQLAKTYATPEVLAARQSLAEIKQSNEYYVEHFDNLIAHYASNGLAESYKNQLIALRNVAQKNLEIIAEGTGLGGANDCYRFPEKCVAIANSILPNVKKIDPSTVSNLLAPIKHVMAITGSNHDGYVTCNNAGGYFWPNGAQVYFFYYPGYYGDYFRGDMHFTSANVSLGAGNISISGRFGFNSNSGNGDISFNGTDDGAGNYVGHLNYSGKLGNGRHINNELGCSISTGINPYYFEPYHSA